jgi:capsular exopolysaccharide synthesis family protein
MSKSKKLEKPHPNLKFQDFFNILKFYKWSIIMMILLSLVLSYGYLYLKPSIYVSYSIIKVQKKGSKESKESKDVINNTISTVNAKDVIEEISLLKTFKINKKALDDVNFKVQYFIFDRYKKIEIYGEQVPIELTDIKIFYPMIIGRLLTIVPSKNGYNLKYNMPYKDKLSKEIFKTDKFQVATMENKLYGETVKNKYFQLKVTRNAKFTQPIHFLMHGNKRSIFTTIIQSKLQVMPLEKDTSLIKISFNDTIPERANLYINALTKSFIDYSIESKNIQNHKTLDFILKELINIKQELKDSEERLETYQLTRNIVQPSVQASLYIGNLSNIEIEISENNLKKKLIVSLINFVQNNYNLESIAPSIIQLKDDNTLTLITKLQNDQIEKEELILEYTDEHPKLIILSKRIETIRQKIEQNLKSLQKNIDYANVNLLKRKISYESEMQTLPSKEKEIINIKRNYEVKSQMYAYLLQKKAENKIIQLATSSNYHIIDEAYNTNIPVKPKRSLVFLLSIFSGLLFGIFISLLRHSKNDLISNKNDLKEATSLPFYGSIPYLKQSENQIEVYNEIRSKFTESYRNIRTNIKLLNKNYKTTVILLTSNIGNEGKSTTSANLAAILEMAKYKTIIINFDLRKPTLHKFFNIKNDKGITTFLEEKHSIEEVIFTTEFENLDIIPSGPIPSNPAELLLSKSLPKLFSQLKEKYEYIILDTAPIGIVSETKSLLEYSDLNLLVFRENYTKKEFITSIEKMIEKHNFKNIGLILNASKEKEPEYEYYY